MLRAWNKEMLAVQLIQNDIMAMISFVPELKIAVHTQFSVLIVLICYCAYTCAVRAIVE